MVQVMACARMWIGVLLGMTLLAGAGSAMSVEDAELEAQFSEGMEALNDNRLKSAIRAFSRILDREPALHRARLELALAYYRSMRYEDAEKLAQAVLDDLNTPPEVRVTVLAFQAQVRRDAEQFARKNHVSGSLAAGFMHDSNVNAGPSQLNIRVGDTPASLTPASVSRSDNAYVLNGGIDHLYKSGKPVEVGERSGMLLWQSGASLYSRQYHTYDDFDLVIASLNTGPALLMLRNWRASLQLKSDYLTLGDRALGWFNSVNPSFTWQFRDGELNWDAIYTRRFYHRDIDKGREGDYLATGATLGHYFDQRRIAATAGGRAIKFFADDDEFGYNGFELNGGISSDTYRNGTAYARYRFSYFSYDGNDPLFGKDREDLEYRATIGLTHTFNEPEDLLKDWVVNGFWERTRNNSNIGQLYSYNRTQLMLMLSRGF